MYFRLLFVHTMLIVILYSY